ncbi:MAG: hypothetical protein KJ950_10480 [Proteobacteria bacterium]|nr:hypothetical protein [Pseudomonadota bacterium]MBU1687511.1 hypothetical protein [Pseudomonadota bacterium]
MQLPQYVTAEEVQRVCGELGLSDWSRKTDDTVDADEAGIILAEVNGEKMTIPVETFIAGLVVELEHGTRFADANVTNNHPLLTGKIVLAHLKETMDYYERILVAELEGDLLKAILAGNPEKVTDKYKKLIDARQELDRSVTNSLGKG